MIVSDTVVGAAVSFVCVISHFYVGCKKRNLCQILREYNKVKSETLVTLRGLWDSGENRGDLEEPPVLSAQPRRDIGG